ncbi:MAG TPA: hypothetical protein VKM72_32420 [Thermoanaerobaculia bacterium]|nr:hypothetical protein [Thermoanaerobaculia bacterium]
MSRKVGSIVIVLVLALCTAGAAFALPLDPDAVEAPEGAGLLGGMWEWLLSWIDRMAGAEDGLGAVWMDGCHIDPNGACVSNH